ncbi:MAG: type II secretion system F family protein [Pirellulaceae bacterium]
MFSPLLIAIAVFAFVVAVVGIVATTFFHKTSTELEDRLTMLTTANAGGKKGAARESISLLTQSLEDVPSFAESLFARFGDLRKLLDQAGVSFSPSQFFLMTLGAAAVGAAVGVFTRLPVWALPLTALTGALLPLMFLVFKRKRRMAKFAGQLPEALELISRALRAGHSLAAGFNLVGDEMAEPIRIEFARAYEEQNLGVPLEEAIQGMTERVPNLDLKFFATAVIMQRQTGGDLAEILDKIGHLIRERFKIWGQIQALTGEGRLSGIVLLALPPILFAVMYKLNTDYVMVLFRDELGKKMLVFAVVMQLMGAYVIRKIINIKV